MSTYPNPHTHDQTEHAPANVPDDPVASPQRFALWHATVHVMPWPLDEPVHAVYIHHHTHHEPGEHDVGHVHSDTVDALEAVAHGVETVDVIDTPAWPHAPRDARDEAVAAARDRQDEAIADLVEVKP